LWKKIRNWQQVMIIGFFAEFSMIKWKRYAFLRKNCSSFPDFHIWRICDSGLWYFRIINLIFTSTPHRENLLKAYGIKYVKNFHASAVYIVYQKCISFFHIIFLGSSERDTPFCVKNRSSFFSFFTYEKYVIAACEILQNN